MYHHDIILTMKIHILKRKNNTVTHASYLGVGDISMKNYRKPINRYFWNYRQLIDIEKWKF